MNLFKKIKSDLDEQIAKDANEKKNQKEISNNKFSWRIFIDGRILTRKGFFKIFGLILFAWILGIYYIGNRYKNEKLMREQTNLKAELQLIESEKLLIIEKLTKISTRNAIKQKLQQKNSNLSDNEGFIKVER